MLKTLSCVRSAIRTRLSVSTTITHSRNAQQLTFWRTGKLAPRKTLFAPVCVAHCTTAKRQSDTTLHKSLSADDIATHSREQNSTTSDDKQITRLINALRRRELLRRLREDHLVTSFLAQGAFAAAFCARTEYSDVLQQYANSLRNEDSSQAAQDLAQQYAAFLRNAFPREYELSRKIAINKQLQDPHLQFGGARKMKRKIFYHHGPTNSGKTRAGLARLQQVQRGLYCAPLRLLAWEVQKDLINEGIACNLITGQEKLYVENATHTSCTVELASRYLVTPSAPEWDVACVDEVQLIGDPERGAAWTDIFLGLKAHEVHVMGDPRALRLIEKLTHLCGDEFHHIPYERMSQLYVEKEVFKLTDLRPGDCIIGFNVNDLVRLRRQINVLIAAEQDANGSSSSKRGNKMIFGGKRAQKNAQSGSATPAAAAQRLAEQHTGTDCAIVYGRMPPEVKKSQAYRFNLDDNDPTRLKYLVATNAIGMGLNFRIKRLIFSTLLRHRKNGPARNIDDHEIAQIAGRAGRYTENGTVTCMHAHDLKTVRVALYRKRQAYFAADGTAEREDLYASVNRAALFPQMQQLVDFQQRLGDILNSSTIEGRQSSSPPPSKRVLPTLSQTLREFVNFARLDELYFVQRYDDFCVMADLIEHCALPVSEQFVFCQAPLNLSTAWKRAQALFVRFAEQYASGDSVVVPTDDVLAQRRRFEYTHADLAFLEEAYHILEVYIWLSMRFPSFTECKRAQNIKAEICALIEEILQKMK